MNDDGEEKLQKAIVVKALSAGFDCGNIAEITINDVSLNFEANSNNHHRGLHVAVIDPLSAKVSKSRVFDTYKSSDDFEEFID